MIEFAGAALAVASIFPVASQRIQTCVTTSIGFGVLCILGIAIATGTAHEFRPLLLATGLTLTIVGALLQGWHRRVAQWSIRKFAKRSLTR
jgi:hypothetical protein